MLNISRFDLVGNHISHNDHLIFEMSDVLTIEDSIVLVDLPSRCETNCVYSNVFRLEVNGYTYQRLLDFYDQLENYITRLDENRRVYAEFVNGECTIAFEVMHPNNNVDKSKLLYSFIDLNGISNNYIFDVNYFILDAISDLLYDLIHDRNRKGRQQTN